MSNCQAIPLADLEVLRRFDTPTICNVVELFNVRPRNTGYMDARIRPCFPRLPAMVGYATTATFRSAAPPRGRDVYGAVADQLAAMAEMPGPAVVVFQDLDDPVAGATFGEVMCTIYRAHGAAGLVTSGAGRDLDQVEALAFPCFTSGTICAHAYCHIVDIQHPVQVGGLMVHPGDLLHGDANGVTTIPNALASAVARACPEFMAAEAVVLNYLKQGRIEPDALQAAQRECRDRIEALARTLRA